jgi:hypothetical protein
VISNRNRLLLAIALVTLGSACDRNPFDPAQVPRVTVSVAGGGGTVTVEWQPPGANLVRVYRGAVPGDGYTDQLMWSVASTSKNSLASGIAYGETPSGGATDVAPKPLVAGEVYTVQVTRADPKGSGDGFTNTSNRYVGTATFTR